MNLQDFLQTFLDFRCTVVQRRAQHQLTKAEQRDHLVQVGAPFRTLGASEILIRDLLELADCVCGCS
jgi:DNA gyrase/topoisomerase IV subunit A